MTENLSNNVLNSLHEFGTQVDKLIERVQQLEEENENLREQLEYSTNSSPFAVTDEELQIRVALLGKAPLDTVIREAGVVLENRLRQIGGEAYASAYGVRLVEQAFDPQTGVFIFSSHSGEQNGVKMLYRGALQFIRNPPMHKLIEYEESTAKLFVKLIDSLLMLLSEAHPNTEGKRWTGEKPVRQVVWEAVQVLTDDNKNRIFAPKDVYQIIVKKYPDFNRSTVGCQIISDCVNHNSRHHYSGGIDRYWWLGKGRYRLYDPSNDNV